MTTITNVVSVAPDQGDVHDSECTILRALDELSQCHRFENSQFSGKGLELLYNRQHSCVAKLTMHSTEGDKLVVVKNIRPVIHSEYSESDQMQSPENIIKNEFMIWKTLTTHPNVASFLGLTNLNGSIKCDELSSGESLHGMAVSKYYAGGSLHGFSCTENRPANERLALLIGVISGLRYIHGLSIVHGDLKAANLLFKHSGKGQVKITDFGSSTMICGEGCPRQHVSQGGPGTQAWDSPELYRRQNPLPRSFASDIWAFGCLALEVQMGLFPYTGRESGNLFLASRLMRKGCPPATEADVGLIIQCEAISRAVWNLIQGCWQRNHEERPSASELMDQLEEIGQDCIGDVADLLGKLAWPDLVNDSASLLGSTPILWNRLSPNTKRYM